MNAFIWNGKCENEIFNIKINLIKQILIWTVTKPVTHLQVKWIVHS